MQENSNKKTVKDFAGILISNIIVLCSSILSSLIIPKYLGTTEYGYYKIYTLYMTYTALLHFGFIDGILLKYAGTDFCDLDKKRFRTFSKMYLGMQICIVGLMLIILMPMFNGIFRFIAFAIALDTLFTNVTAYYQFVSQCTMRFKELSVRKIMFAILKIIAVLLIIAFYKMGAINRVSCAVYVSSILLINLILTVWYVITYRELTFGTSYCLRSLKNEICELFLNGIVLTVAFQIANLIFTLDRQFVSVLFVPSVYGIYSFAYSIIGMANTVIGAISTVLLPNLRRRGINSIEKDFPLGISIVAILVFATMCMYFPLRFFVNCFLPDYISAMEYLRIIFPGLALSSCISAIIFTYYKVVCEQKAYCIISCCIFAVSAIANWISYLAFRTPEAISWASVVTLFFWFVVSTMYLARKYHFKWKKELVYICTEAFFFYLTTAFFAKMAVVGMMSFTVAFCISTLVWYKDTIMVLIKRKII